MTGLHAARQKHKGQFWTPDNLAAFAWKVVEPSINAALAKAGDRVAILDNSVGTGALLQYASPSKHELYGIDVDSKAVAALGEAAEAAGFTCDFRVCGMEDANPSGFGVGIINPPFSLKLSSPHLRADFESTHYGEFGPGSAAISHFYAIEQAVNACSVVVAIVPQGFTESAKRMDSLSKRLIAVYHMPDGSFKEEGTDVKVDLLLFGDKESAKTPEYSISSYDEMPSHPVLPCKTITETSPSLNCRQLAQTRPVIRTPVTGDTSVNISHNGRKLFLKFKCGLTEAMVMNAVLMDEAPKLDGLKPHVYPKGVRFTGQGLLDIEIHLIQNDPMNSIMDFMETIRKAGGTPTIDPGTYRYIQKRICRLDRELAPFEHWVQTNEITSHTVRKFKGIAKKDQTANPNAWLSPFIPEGTEIEFTPDGEGSATFTLEDEVFSLTIQYIQENFSIDRNGPDEIEGCEIEGWVKIHESPSLRFPSIAQSLRKRATRLGIFDWLTWEFQQNDLIDALIKPRGAILGWDMGAGKSRLAIALCLLVENKHNLIATEPYLITEMRKELEKLPPDVQRNVKFITSKKDIENLKKINIISYNRLRSKIEPASKKTYADRLRRRIGVLVADEGDLLRNTKTLQTKAVWKVSAKRRYVLSGTPISNYPRNMLPILALTSGSATAAQPYGIHAMPYLEPRLRNGMHYCMRGMRKFADDFVVMEWVTHEFTDTLITGGKREVPKVLNPTLFQSWIAPHVLRRRRSEPALATYIKTPKAKYRTVTVQWDNAHLAFYLKTAEEFSSWYKQAKKSANDSGKSLNMVTLLARINAVRIACNAPHKGVGDFGMYWPVTSKQRQAIEMIQEAIASGRKTMLFATNPETLDRFDRLLAEEGIESIVLHGNKTTKDRDRGLHLFRTTDCPVALASYGVMQKGHNVPEANNIILYDRQWSATTERQSIARALRPEQSCTVTVTMLHLKGSIDEYQAQMVEHKADCAKLLLDHEKSTLGDADFIHMDSILADFCEHLASMYGVEKWEIRKKINEVA